MNSNHESAGRSDRLFSPQPGQEPLVAQHRRTTLFLESNARILQVVIARRSQGKALRGSRTQTPASGGQPEMAGVCWIENKRCGGRSVTSQGVRGSAPRNTQLSPLWVLTILPGSPIRVFLGENTRSPIFTGQAHSLLESLHTKL